ncbi:MAG: hypothetical protein RIT01_518 [Pseudomonadota bacterium]
MVPLLRTQLEEILLMMLPKINPDYLKLNNLFLLPHLGSATVRTRIDMGNRAIDNLENFFNNKKPKDQVN